MIRRMTPDDVDAVAAIQAQAFPGETVGFTALQLQIELARERSFVWCATDERNVVVGVLIAWRVDEDFELLNMAVAQSARLRGVGVALLDALLAHARDAVATQPEGARVFLEVRTDNAPARALYQKRGFELLRVRKAYYQDGCDALELCHVCHTATNRS